MGYPQAIALSIACGGDLWDYNPFIVTIFAENIFMKRIHRYRFHKTKYGQELLIDVVALENIKPYILKHPAHTLSYYDITFLTGGRGSISIGEKQYALTRGDVVFSKPADIRRWDTDTLPQGYALIFEEDFLLSFFNDRSFIRKLAYFNPAGVCAAVRIGSIYPRIENLIREIAGEIDNGQSKDTHILRALLYEILMLLNREYINRHPDGDSKNEKKRNRFTENFINAVEKDFKIYRQTSYYAGVLCVTPNYLNEIVKKSLGQSPKCYIQNRIVAEAKKWLAYTDLPVAEIAGKLNIDDSSYFIRLFRRRTGMTPLQYRRSIVR